MASDNVTLGIDIDTSAADASIDNLMTRCDEVTRKAIDAHKTVMQKVRQGMTMISSMMSSFHQAMSLFGLQVDSFYGALIGMTLSTISMILSIAAGLAVTGVGIPASVALMAVAVGLNILTIGKLISDKMHTEGIWNDIIHDAQRATYDFNRSGPRTPTGGSF